jgi:hypothetical protein
MILYLRRGGINQVSGRLRTAATRHCVAPDQVPGAEVPGRPTGSDVDEDDVELDEARGSWYCAAGREGAGTGSEPRLLR